MDAQETTIYNAIIITSLVLGVIILFFIISITRQQRRNLELHRLKILAEITTLERERARIASDLHDDLGPLLSAVKLKISSFELTDPDDKLQMDLTNHHIDDILKRIRDISFDLMPNALVRKGLATALKEFLDYLNNDGGRIKFVFESVGDINVAEQKAVNIYRIVQEAAHNAIKHSGATQFLLRLETKNKNLQITIKDNGKGFDKEKVSAATVGFGLRGLLSRSEVIGGKMYLESRPGEGTTYSFEIPV
jgi:signal transduction histidine kinase